MTFRDIIMDNRENHSPVSWWPLFAYHCTDVTNVVSILKTGCLYSRNEAVSKGLMLNDNASRQVIENTYNNATTIVRLYFRPLTPTQYFNEGYKHPALRYDSDPNANIPVPVFLLFDLEKVLNLETTRFSEKTLAGVGAERKRGVEDFSRLNFDAIYSSGWENSEQNRPYRHAEIVCSSPLKLKPNIRRIVCRNPIERATLLSLLKEEDGKLIEAYSSIIVVGKEKLFERNALFIENYNYHDDIVVFSLSDSYEKRSYIRKQKEKYGVIDLGPIEAKMHITWLFPDGHEESESYTASVDYEKDTKLRFSGIRVKPGAEKIVIKLFIDEKLMCFVSRSLESGEVIE